MSLAQFPAISGDTHAPINPIQLLLLYFWRISDRVSPVDKSPFFLRWTPTKTGLFNYSATLDAISISLPLEITSKYKKSTWGAIISACS